MAVEPKLELAAAMWFAGVWVLGVGFLLAQAGSANIAETLNLNPKIKLYGLGHSRKNSCGHLLLRPRMDRDPFKMNCKSTTFYLSVGSLDKP